MFVPTSKNIFGFERRRDDRQLRTRERAQRLIANNERRHAIKSQQKKHEGASARFTPTIATAAVAAADAAAVAVAAAAVTTAAAAAIIDASSILSALTIKQKNTSARPHYKPSPRNVARARSLDCRRRRRRSKCENERRDRRAIFSEQLFLQLSNLADDNHRCLDQKQPLFYERFARSSSNDDDDELNEQSSRVDNRKKKVQKASVATCADFRNKAADRRVLSNFKRARREIRAN